VERLQGALALLDWAGPARNDRDERVAMAVLGMNGNGGAI